MNIRLTIALTGLLTLSACSTFHAESPKNDALIVPPDAPAGDLYPQGEGVNIHTSKSSRNGIEMVDPGDKRIPDVTIRGKNVPLVWNRGAAEAYDVQVGIASYYWQPQKTATGEQFNPDAFTAAHRTLPFGTVVRCTRIDNKKSVIVYINDRGPYVDGRIIDLSRAAGHALDMKSVGITNCMIEVLAYPAVEMLGPDGTG